MNIFYVTSYPYVIPRLPSFIFGEMIVLGYHTFTLQDFYFMNFLLYKTPLIMRELMMMIMVMMIMLMMLVNLMMTSREKMHGVDKNVDDGVVMVVFRVVMIRW